MFTYKNIHKLNKRKYLLAILTRVIYNSIVSSQNPDQAETVCLLKTKLRRQLNHEKQKGIIHRTNRVNCSNVCRFDLRTKPAFAGHNICCRTIQSFTPAAIPGLTIGCVLSNIANIGAGLPLDMIFGSLATLGATLCIYLLRNVKIKTYPLLSMLMPAIFNGVIVGWEIETFFIDGPFKFADFLVQGGLVALGELGVMLVLGTILYYTMKKRNLDKRIFSSKN